MQEALQVVVGQSNKSSMKKSITCFMHTRSATCVCGSPLLVQRVCVTSTGTGS